MPHDDFAVEPIPGLPEAPPAGEEILWQGRPATWALAREALNIGWVAGYFALLTVWRFVSVVDLMPLGQAIAAALPMVIIGAVACLLLLAMAWVQARCTMYTVTSSRVAMRIGAALTLTLNIPYTQVANAVLDLRKGGTGTIALETMGKSRLSIFVIWPHARPWRFNPTQPALRCIPDAERVAALIADAAEARISVPQVARTPEPIAAE
ncbi:MAG: photosynthetic complex putative assembly protein PuhB [Pseudomonadota bacterium]